jgi:hypothetical protein
MPALNQVAAASPVARPDSLSDKLAVKLFTNRFRWFTTVALEGALGLFFLFAPGLTVALLQVSDTIETRLLFALYGGLLLHRAAMEQYVRWRQDPALIRGYMWSTYPFGLSSAVLLGWASLQRLMNPIIGWIWVVFFVGELGHYSVVLYLHWSEQRRRA